MRGLGGIVVAAEPEERARRQAENAQNRKLLVLFVRIILRKVVMCSPYVCVATAAILKTSTSPSLEPDPVITSRSGAPEPRQADAQDGDR